MGKIYLHNTQTLLTYFFSVQGRVTSRALAVFTGVQYLLGEHAPAAAKAGGAGGLFC